MKKTLIILAITVIAIQVNAQWFIGGDIGVNVSNVNENREFSGGEININNTNAGFSIAPRFGYYFNSKFALGLSVSMGANFLVNTSGINTKYQEYSIRWGAFPFVRYSVFTYKKFSVILQGSTGVGGSHGFWKVENLNTERGLNALAIRVFNISPILGFNLTDHIHLEAGLNFLNLGYNIDIIKGTYYQENFKVNSIRHDFNIGFKSSSILSLGQLQFGMIYKF